MALPNFNIKHYLAVGLVLVWAGLGFYFTKHDNSGLREVASDEDVSMLPLEQAFPHLIMPQSTLFSVLTKLGVEPQTIQQIVNTAKPIYNLTKIKPGIRFQLLHENQPGSEVIGITFRFSPIELLEIKKTNGEWVAEKKTEEVETRVVTFSGLVTSSLWESAEKAKMDPNLISDLAEIFAWQVDFAREVRINDRWRLSVEQKLVRGEPYGWGDILAAEYVNDGLAHQAVLFRLDGKNQGYFEPDGSSLRKMFLKSPIRYGRISSRFQRRRFHPILQVNRPHLGVDYAAPIGTPVRAVGDGTITFAGWSGGGGKVIKIRHNSIYQTAYKHLNGYAPGIRNGSRVQQGQVIGYVGNTGLSSGPHLHFEFFQRGVFVDPLSRKFPSADPVPKAQMAEFQSGATSLLKSLPGWEAIDLAMRGTASVATDKTTAIE